MLSALVNVGGRLDRWPKPQNCCFVEDGWDADDWGRGGWCLWGLCLFISMSVFLSIWDGSCVLIGMISVLFSLVVGVYMPNVRRVAWEYFRVWSISSIFKANHFSPSKGKPSAVHWISLGNPEEWSRDVWCITIAVAWATVSATSRDDCKAVLAMSWPSVKIELNWSLFYWRRSLIKFTSLQ